MYMIFKLDFLENWAKNEEILFCIFFLFFHKELSRICFYMLFGTLYVCDKKFVRCE